MKKTILEVIGVFLVLGSIGKLGNLSDWSTAETVGFNAWTVFSVIGGE